MLDSRILLTTPAYPYPTLPANDSLTDATGQRFTKGDDIFTIVSHTHCFAAHILAQNIEEPAVVLEYPRWEDFTAEVDRGYPIVGISAYPVHLERVMEMCQYVRRRSPGSQILLGSYAAQAFEASYGSEVKRRYVDHVVVGEGVSFLRSLLGHPPIRHIKQALMPKAGGAPPYLSRHPGGCIGFLVSGLGCIGGCDFCSTTSQFSQVRTQLLSPDELVEHIHLYAEHFPQVSQVFVIEEDHFRYPGYLHRMKQYWESNPAVVEKLDWFGFGSIDHIARFADKFGWDALAEIGIGCIFIGVESKFAGEHGYSKRTKADAREVFRRLHSMGIRTVGAWMCGWDFHHHGNVMEDLNYFVSLYPTYQQLTRVSPFPGTPLWERLRAEGRVDEVPWEDVHFWSGAQKNVAFESHETLNITEHGYDLLYRTWGPSTLRRLDVQLEGYAFCMRSDNPILRRHKSLFFKRQCAMLWTNLRAMDRFAPNGVVRRRVRKIDDKYRRLIGPPTPTMQMLAAVTDKLATVYKLSSFFDPLNRHPKEEPYRRYLYGGDVAKGSPVPYRKESAPMSEQARREMRVAEVVKAAIGASLRAARLRRAHDGDDEVDEMLLGRLGAGRLGFGF